MWSGPRNISTALMRSWGNRADTAVCDEPFYAHYLQHTGLAHPGAAEVIAAQETDWRKVAAYLGGAVPEGKRIFYQKHMAHHLLAHMSRGWIEELTSCFLIRDPVEMLASLARITPRPTLSDTGLPQQVEIFELVRRAKGAPPAVLDARDVLEDPRGLLSLLCETLEVEFREEMLSWPPGGRPTDGVWARHWYGEVENSTAFKPYRPKAEPLQPHLRELCAQCMGYYKKLHAFRLCSKSSTRRTAT
jgi:hypothetical protein